MTGTSKSVLWLAQGFGIGRIPIAPGTFGSMLGLAWFLLLLLPRNTWLFVTGCILGTVASIWICGEAERLLNTRDPGSVVLDEMVAMPLCFAWWVGRFHSRNGGLPPPEHFFTASSWLLTLGVFLAFRLFDVWKPWPIRQSQQLPGGWGVTVDDLLAALGVNLLMVIALNVPVIAHCAAPEFSR
jgi:phosphatidylglycerophosphatase A